MIERVTRKLQILNHMAAVRVYLSVRLICVCLCAVRCVCVCTRGVDANNIITLRLNLAPATSHGDGKTTTRYVVRRGEQRKRRLQTAIIWRPVVTFWSGVAAQKPSRLTWHFHTISIRSMTLERATESTNWFWKSYILVVRKTEDCSCFAVIGHRPPQTTRSRTKRARINPL